MRLDGRWGWIDDTDCMIAMPDVSMWLQLLSKGDLIYISECLSFFRIHDGQSQNSFDTTMRCLISWGRELAFAYENKCFFDNETEYHKAMHVWVEILSQRIAEGMGEKQESAAADVIFKYLGLMQYNMAQEYIQREVVPVESIYNGELPFEK